MKKLILSIILIFSALIVPAVGHCDYAIHLKNGGRFLTPRYWEQDQEIQFYIEGGVMGIEKNSVERIIPVKTRYRDADITENASALPSGETKAASPGKGTVTPKEETPLKEEEVYSRKVDEVMARAQTISSMSKEELLALSSEIASLKREIVSKNLAGLYAGKYQELFTANDAIKEELNRRF